VSTNCCSVVFLTETETEILPDRDCETDLMALDRLLYMYLFAYRFYVLVPFLSVLVTCGRQSWPALWSSFGRM